MGRCEDRQAVLNARPERTKDDHGRAHAEPTFFLRIVGRDHVAHQGAEACFDEAEPKPGRLKFEALVETNSGIAKTGECLPVAAMF